MTAVKIRFFIILDFEKWYSEQKLQCPLDFGIRLFTNLGFQKRREE